MKIIHLKYTLAIMLISLPSIAAAKEVKLLLDWSPNTNHTGIYVAKEKGWYDDLNLKIIIPGEGDPHTLAANQAVDIAVSYQESFTLARAAGVPVVSIGAVIQHNTSGFASRANKNITSPKDFVNKRYGSFGSPMEKPFINRLVECDKAQANKVDFIDIGWADFLSVTEKDRVDFSWIYYGWAGIDAKLKGVDINVVMLSDYKNCVPDYYTPIFITSETSIKEKPEIISKFMQATARGYEFAIANPKQAASILLKQNPELPKELVNASQKWLADKYQAKVKQWGWQKESVFENYSRLMIEQGIIKSFDSKKAFTNQFLPK